MKALLDYSKPTILREAPQDILTPPLKWKERQKRTYIEITAVLWNKGRQERKLQKEQRPIISLWKYQLSPILQKDPSPIKWYHSPSFAFGLSFLLFILLFPLLFLSCNCCCSFNLFLKVQIEIPALIPQKQLCFPCPCLAQLVVWLCATISYTARSDVAKEHLVQCHFLSKPNSITMNTGPRSHQSPKISLW